MVSKSSGIYLIFPEQSTYNEALKKCQYFGMTLLELYTQSQVDKATQIIQYIHSNM